jgi:hypothetical protein
LLALTQRCQEHDFAIRKLKGIVVSSESFFVNLPKDRRLMIERIIVPWPQSSWQALNLMSKS